MVLVLKQIAFKSKLLDLDSTDIDALSAWNADGRQSNTEQSAPFHNCLIYKSLYIIIFAG
jgi:hypothetical protein